MDNRFVTNSHPHNINSFGMNVISSRNNNFLAYPYQQRSNSLQINRPFSNLSELSKTKKEYLKPINYQQEFGTMKTKNLNEQKEGLKTHKLGKKFKTVKF